MVARVLGVEYVLVDYEGCPPGLRRGPEADLAEGAELAEDVVHLLPSDLVGEVADVEDAVHLGGEADLIRKTII